MKYEFRAYTKMQPITVRSTGKIYEIGEHPTYKDHIIIEVLDDDGKIHDVFEDELKSDEFEKPKIKYTDEDVENILIEYVKTNPTKPYNVITWFNEFKKK